MTATQWLFDKLWNTSKDKFEWHAILKEAKEMEKEQLKKSYEKGKKYKKPLKDSNPIYKIIT